MVDLVPPSRWSAEPWRYERMLGEDTSSQMDGWAVHWPGSRVTTFASPTLADSIARLLSWERFHTDPPPDGKGWRGLAYDYAVDMAGRAFRIRGTGQSGATSGDYDEDGVPNNRETDAVLLILGAADVPSSEMLSTFVALVDQLGGPREYLIGHRQARGTDTTCPGDHAMAHVVQPAQDWPAFAASHIGDDVTPQDKADIIDGVLKALRQDRRMTRVPLDVKILDWSSDTNDRVMVADILKGLHARVKTLVALVRALAAEHEDLAASIADAEGLTVEEARTAISAALSNTRLTVDEEPS